MGLNIIILAFIGAIIFIYYFEKKLGEGLIICAEDEMERLISVVMNNCIKKYSEEDRFHDEEILEITRGNAGEIEFISYNTRFVNKIAVELADMLEEDMKYLVKGYFEKIDLSLSTITDEYYEKLAEGIVFTVSMGSATGNSLLSNIGPKIPLNLSLVGDVLTNVYTNVKEYGMNNALVEVLVKMEATVVIQMPFMSKRVKVENDIPLSMEVIQGNVPGYYFGGEESTYGD